MHVRLLSGFLSLGMLGMPAAVAQPAPPLFETRAVWFSPALEDGSWPYEGLPAFNQRQLLRALFLRARDAGMNTIVFHVTNNGDAAYRSDRLPPMLQLARLHLGDDVDPLAMAIDVAHGLGMELHAWINVFWVGDAETVGAYAGRQPEHVVYAHPSWVHADGPYLWIDPASEAARAWLVDNVRSLVARYDVDGVQLDYVRYPAGGFGTDAAAYAAAPKGMVSLDDWRRDNVSAFVAAASEAIRREKPWVQVGATPIGNYYRTMAWPALWAYSDVYQESRRWLLDGWVDYLTPQLYFSIGTQPEAGTDDPSPDFETVLEGWEQAAEGRTIYTGIAAFKPSEGRFSPDQLTREIDLSRNEGAEGQMFFRYNHFLDYEHMIGAAYPRPSLPQPATLRDEAQAPPRPARPMVIPRLDGTVNVAWAPVSGTADDPLRGYALFRRLGSPPATDTGTDLLAFVDAAATTFTDAVPPDNDYFYRVAAVSRLGMMSDASVAVSVSGTVVQVERAVPEAFRVESLYPNPARDDATLTFTAGTPLHVRVRVYDVLGRPVLASPKHLYHVGTQQLRLDVSALPAGLYLCRIEADGQEFTRRFVVAR